MKQPIPSATATMCTAPQLARLAGLTPQFLSQHPELLPEPMRPRTGASGRPPKAWTLEQIAELILQRTAGWSDLELRVRAALIAPRPAEADMSNPLPGFRHIAGSDLLVPSQAGIDRVDEAPEHERSAILAALEQERTLDEQTRSAARARSRARKAHTTNRRSQP